MSQTHITVNTNDIHSVRFWGFLEIFHDIAILVEVKHEGRHVPEFITKTIKFADIGMIETSPFLSIGTKPLSIIHVSYDGGGLKDCRAMNLY